MAGLVPAIDVMTRAVLGDSRRPCWYNPAAVVPRHGHRRPDMLTRLRLRLKRGPTKNNKDVERHPLAKLPNWQLC